MGTTSWCNVSSTVRFTAVGGAVNQTPSFLKQDPTQEPPLANSGEGTGRGYTLRGCLLGAILATSLWFVPIPVAVVVWVFGLKGPFVDYMLMATPFFVALPLIGAEIGELYGRKRAARRQR
jgi:hypothetical protein